MLKVTHISTALQGGAGVAAVRLHQALLAHGVASRMLHLFPLPHAVATETRQYRQRTPLLLAARRRVAAQLSTTQSYIQGIRSFNDCTLPGFDMHALPRTPHTALWQHPWVQDADVVHLHFIGKFIDWPSFFPKVEKPIFWTLHDMGAFTGTCHYSFECAGYHTRCATCPQVRKAALPLVANAYTQKADAYARLAHPLHIITPSHWLGQLSTDSPLTGSFPHTVIPYCLDVERYAPVADKQALRQQMGLNPELPVLLFVSEQVDNRRKGFELLLQALQQLPPDLPLQLLVVGRTTDRLADIPLPHVHLGALDEHQMAKAYQAADVFAMPSLYDNYPNTVLEAYACGLAVIGFGASGVQEMLQPMGQELTVTPYDTAEMAQKLEALVRTNRYQALGALGRAHILQHHQPATIAAAHLAYYATRSQS